MKLIRIKAVDRGDWADREQVVVADVVRMLRSYRDTHLNLTVYQVLLGEGQGWLHIEREQYEAIIEQMEKR